MIKEFKDHVEQLDTSRANGGRASELKSEVWNDDNEWVAELKLDGTRLLMHITPEGNRFNTRRITETTGKFMERTNNVPHFRDMELPELYGTILDGEGLAPVEVDTMGATQSIVGASPEHAWEKQKEIGLLEYHTFDILKYKGEDLRKKPYHERLKYLEMVLKIIWNKYPNIPIKRVPQVARDKKGYYTNLVKEGKEGVMLKNMNGLYGDRKMMLKAKKSQRWTMIITGFKEGDGKYKGAVGSVGVGFYGEEQLTYASGLSDEQRWDMAKNPDKYLGQVVEVEAQELTKTGSLRHPRLIDFRIDKRPEDCTRTQNSEVK